MLRRGTLTFDAIVEFDPIHEVGVITAIKRKLLGLKPDAAVSADGDRWDILLPKGSEKLLYSTNADSLFEQGIVPPPVGDILTLQYGAVGKEFKNVR